MEPLSAPEAIIVSILAVLATAYLVWGPAIEARIEVWKMKKKQDRPTGDDNYYQGRG